MATRLRGGHHRRGAVPVCYICIRFANAVDRDVIVRQKALDLGMAQHDSEELGGTVRVEQPVAVLPTKSL